MKTLVSIPAGSVILEGMLAIPEKAKGMVIFAHGSGSSRLSPRNNFVAQVLRHKRLATLLFDLLTEEEDEVYQTRFDISLLTKRLKTATEWFQKQKESEELTIGYFGASTGAAAALKAAADLGDKILAVVSRGGRPDLALRSLPYVKAASLLIVGGNDQVVIELNKEAFKLIEAEKDLKIIPGASHLFEEPGTLEQAAKLAAEWFRRYLTEKSLVF